MVHPERQAALSRQISAIDTRQQTYALSRINTLWSKSGSDSSSSGCGTDTSVISRRNVHKRVAFTLNPIHEHNDSQSVLETESKCITNVEAIAELETESSNNSSSI